MNTLHTKYRPTVFREVIGNAATVISLTAHLDMRTQRAFIFHGPPGTGKTTFARLVIKAVDAHDFDCVEFNAGADTGVEGIRSLLEMCVYPGMGANENKVFILDECHMLSRNSWNALLKIVDELVKARHRRRIPITIYIQFGGHADEQHFIQMNYFWLLSNILVFNHFQVV